MNTSRRFRTYFVFGLTALFTLSAIYFAYAHVDGDNSWKSNNGVSVNAIASHYHGYNKKNGVWRNYQSARHSATLSAENHDVGYSVNGRFDIYAYCGGFSGEHGPWADWFTLKVKPKKKILGIKVGKKGDSHSRFRYDFFASSEPKYGGAADAYSECDGLKTRVVSTSEN